MSTMQIDDYRFGHISVAGRQYDADVITFPDHVQERWWRREGHRLETEDLHTVLANPPELLVVGTGYYGRMQVPQQTLEALRAAGIQVKASKTSDAVTEFNRSQRECPRIVAALHLTC